MQERTPDDEPSSMVVLVIGCQSTSKVLKDEEGGYCLLGFVGLPIDHRYRRDRTVAPTTFHHLVGKEQGIDRTIRRLETKAEGASMTNMARKWRSFSLQNYDCISGDRGGAILQFDDTAEACVVQVRNGRCSKRQPIMLIRRIRSGFALVSHVPSAMTVLSDTEAIELLCLQKKMRENIHKAFSNTDYNYNKDRST
jgi:hypothetical protein